MGLKDEILQLGASEVGFFHIDEPVLGLSYGISVVLHLSESVIDEIEDAPTHTYFHHYRTVNAFLDQLALKIGLLLEKKGYRYVCVPASQTVDQTQKSGLFSHKKGARLSGLGVIGKSGLFLSTKYGPRVRLVTVLTDMPQDSGAPIENDVCKNCDKCVKSCPAMAIVGNPYYEGIERKDLIDANACSQYMKDHFKHIGRGAVCGICMKVCPNGGIL